jgi:serpin B
MNIFVKSHKNVRLLVGILVLIAVLGSAAACTGPAKILAADLTEGYTSRSVSGKETDQEFINEIYRFYAELLRRTSDPQDNALVSPLSVLVALAMTANGADGQTRIDMESVLSGSIPLEELNQYLYTYIQNLPSDPKARLTMANSIWFRDDENRLQVEPDFLQANADYYRAQAYKAPFNDQTLKDINTWVEEKTEGMIDSILEEIRDDAVMYLLNALVFDAEWQEIYRTHQIQAGEFAGADGIKYAVEFMYSEESTYLSGQGYTGFSKPYAGGHYSFVAILPDAGEDTYEFLTGLDGAQIRTIFNSTTETAVEAWLPKFSYEYEVSLNDPLKEMGMEEAFSPVLANFLRLGRSSRGNIYIGDVLHKTFIAVDERGTRAGAVTKVEMRDEAYRETKMVRLDRPFVYAIVENGTGLPVFVGTVMNFANQ